MRKKKHNCDKYFLSNFKTVWKKNGQSILLIWNENEEKKHLFGEVVEQPHCHINNEKYHLLWRRKKIKTIFQYHN